MTYAEPRVGNAAGVKARGILAKAVFRAKKSGNTTVRLEYIRLVNDEEGLISGVLKDDFTESIVKNLMFNTNHMSYLLGVVM